MSISHTVPQTAAATSGDVPSMASLEAAIEADIWHWLKTFVTVKNDFYHGKFAPCPYARAAVLAKQVDVTVYDGGDLRAYIRARAFEICTSQHLSTRVMAFAPRVQLHWGMTEFIESLNMELIASNVFLNTGVTKTMPSRHSGAKQNTPYFIVVANKLDAVLDGSKALLRTKFYKDWPQEQYQLVVERRERLANQYKAK